MSTPTPLYLPFMLNSRVVSMGVKPLDMACWVEIDDNFSHYHANKIHLYTQNPQRVYTTLDSSYEAQQELNSRLLSHLLDHYPGIYSLDKDDNLIHHGLVQPGASTADLWQISLRVQEDLCLLQKSGDDYHLTAASLCAPSEWNLADKIGQPISTIHAPVPELNKQLGQQINHVFDKLSPLRPYQRFNWSLKESDSLALFPDSEPASSEQLFLRVERQTLTRLPTTQAIAFTIKVYIYPLSSLTRVPNALSSLLDAVHAMSPGEVRYKSMDKLYPALRTFCKQNTSQPI